MDKVPAVSIFRAILMVQAHRSVETTTIVWLIIELSPHFEDGEIKDSRNSKMQPTFVYTRYHLPETGSTL